MMSDDSGYFKLASAIVASGMEDYYESGKKAVAMAIDFLKEMDFESKERKLKTFQGYVREIWESIDFFHSGWFAMLTEADGPTIHSMLKRKVNEYGRERILELSKKTV